MIAAVALSDLDHPEFAENPQLLRERLDHIHPEQLLELGVLL